MLKNTRKRFETTLCAYKLQNVNVAKSLVALNIAQVFVITLGMCLTLTLAQYYITKKKL